MVSLEHRTKYKCVGCDKDIQPQVIGGNEPEGQEYRSKNLPEPWAFRLDFHGRFPQALLDIS